MVENYELMRWKCDVTMAVGTIAYAAVPVHMPLEINPRVHTQVRNCTYYRCVLLYIIILNPPYYYVGNIIGMRQ